MSQFNRTLLNGVLMALCVSVSGCSSTQKVQQQPVAAKPKMHPSWDKNHDGLNDCEMDGSCDHTVDYTQPRPTPSFDCENTSGAVQTLICNDAFLTGLDNQMHQVYQAALTKSDEHYQPTLKAMQRGWMKGRDDCWKNADPRSCAVQQYQHRVAELQASFGLVASQGKVFYRCDGIAAKEVVATYYVTFPASLIAEYGDQVSFMIQVPAASGSKYQGRNESLWEHQGEATITWGYDTKPMRCIAHLRE